MATLQFNFPSTSVTASNPAVGPNGSTAPAYSTEIGFINGSGNLTGVSTANPLPVDVKSIVATNVDIEYSKGVNVASNSTTTPLGISGNFTGAWTDATNYTSIQVGIYTDQNSASLGFKIEFSASGTTVDHTHYYTYESSSSGTGYAFQPEFKYFRVNYTNTTVAQTYLTIYTTMRPIAVFPSQYRVEQAITGQSQALVTKGVIYGLTTGGGGGYVAVKVNPSGALTADVSGSTGLVLGAGTAAIGSVTVSNFPATQPVSGTVAATQSGTWNVGLNTGSNAIGSITNTSFGISGSLPAGSNAIGSITNTSFGISGSLPAGTNSIGFIKKQGLAIANSPVYNSYSSTNVTTSAYTQLIASTTSATNMVQVFDSSGQAMILATGAAGSEVIQAYIPPGGADFNLAIAAGTRVAIKALTANATSGYLLVNLLG
jgi:hypothetical protein